MNAANFIALGASLLAATVAVTVPLVAFRMTLRLEQIKWVRDQRAQLYIDMLAEAHAETDWFRRLMTQHEIAISRARRSGDPVEDAGSVRYTSRSPDLRMGPAERAQLGARAQAFASSAVAQAFNKLTTHIFVHITPLPESEGAAQVARIEADHAHNALSQLIRAELGAGELPLPTRP